MGKEKVTLSDPDTLQKKQNEMGYVISRLSYPVEIIYDGQSVMVPPRGKLEAMRQNKIYNLPKGLQFIKENK